MVRPGSTPPSRPRHQRAARCVCAGAMATAGMLYLASPYVALWSMHAALKRHDDAALRASLNWELVRAGLKDGLGLNAPVQQGSQQDELPGFGESFATNIASGMIDDEITPERLDSMISGPALQDHALARLPRGVFTGPTRFHVAIRMTGERTPIEITLHLEKWRWKVTRITLPEDMLAPPPTNMAGMRS